jgi:hypothetical protein
MLDHLPGRYGYNIDQDGFEQRLARARHQILVDHKLFAN